MNNFKLADCKKKKKNGTEKENVTYTEIKIIIIISLHIHSRFYIPFYHFIKREGISLNKFRTKEKKIRRNVQKKKSKRINDLFECMYVCLRAYMRT